MRPYIDWTNGRYMFRFIGSNWFFMHFFHVHWTEPFGGGSKEVEIVTSPAQEIVEKPSEHDQNDVVEKDENISLQDIEEKDSVNEALKVKDAPELQPFFKMLRMGVPLEAVKLKMSRENLNPNLLDIPDSDYTCWLQMLK